MNAGGTAQHRRGHSTGSIMASMEAAAAARPSGKERDEDLALFHEMKARERIHFLHPSTEDDIEASLRYRIVATAPPPQQHKSPNDLLGQEPDKNDYDWLLTPPGTPLFPSLDRDLPSEAQLEAASIRATTRSRPSRISRGSSSPSRRPSSPSPSSSTSSLSRRPSFGNSSPSRPGSSSSRPVTPTGARPSTPGRSSTPTRRTLTTSASFGKTTAAAATSNNVGRSARSSSPSSRKPRTPVHPAMPAGFASDPPPNLRTSMPDRPSSSNTRGASLSPRLGGGGGSSFKSSDNRRAVSPSLSRSYSSSASSSKGSVISSSHNSGIEVNRPSPRVVITDSGGKRPISGCEETSPVKPVTKKPVRTGGTGGFSAINSQRTASSSRQMDFRRNSSSGFRPLMSNSHISSFYTRASNSLQQRSMATDSSINSSSAASVEHEQDDELASKMSRDEERDEFASLDAMIDDRKAEELLEDSLELAEETTVLEIVEELEPMVEQQAQAQAQEEMVIERSDHHTPTSSDHSPHFQEEEEIDMEIDESPRRSVDESPQIDEDKGASMRSLLELVISKAVDLAENESAKAPPSSSKVPGAAAKPRSEDPISEPPSSNDPSVHCFSQLLDPKYCSSSLEVYQFDQELHTTGSEVANDLKPSRDHRRSPISPSTSTTTISDKKACTSSSSSASQLSENFASRSHDRGDHPKTSSTNTDVHPAGRSSSSRPSSTTTTTRPRDPPSFGGFFSASRHYRRRDSRESSLFSIQISSSKGGESISSGGRPASTTDDSVDDITPRRIHHLDLACNGDASSNGTYTYKASDEYDTKSEESCVDYYIDSMDPPEKFVDKTTSDRGVAIRTTIKECEILASPREEDVLPGGFDNDEEGYVDYYIDDFSSRQKMADDQQQHEFTEPAAKKAIANHRPDAMDIVMEEERSLLVVDDTHIEVCSMEESSSSECGDRRLGHRPGTSGEDDHREEEIDTMTECWKQLEEAEQHQHHHHQESSKLPGTAKDPNTTSARARAIPSSESATATTRENILFCSSIVHDLVYRAASLGIEKEDLKAASADELVTFLGLSKTHHIPPKFVDLDPTKWKASEESTVRRTLTYLQNQKLMQKTTVAFMHSPPVGRVEEDVKDHIIPEHHFIDPSLEKGSDAVIAESRRRRRSKAKCRCVIL